MTTEEAAEEMVAEEMIAEETTSRREGKE